LGVDSTDRIAVLTTHALFFRFFFLPLPSFLIYFSFFFFGFLLEKADFLFYFIANAR